MVPSDGCRRWNSRCRCGASLQRARCLARHTTRQVTRGVAETDTEIWDVNGELVAMARQTYKVRMPKGD